MANGLLLYYLHLRMKAALCPYIAKHSCKNDDQMSSFGVQNRSTFCALPPRSLSRSFCTSSLASCCARFSAASMWGTMSSNGLSTIRRDFILHGYITGRSPHALARTKGVKVVEVLLLVPEKTSKMKGCKGVYMHLPDPSRTRRFCTPDLIMRHRSSYYSPSF
ncbi:uncharacterized protein EI90DRAFT_964847 [Cantharellus anzutake]|uniref:uncharacterized protein n=1 Tax=Cantharellus anzutake TaxID=1750568 RepID=UPI001904891E|nr:uncharacterized protein EI90DRAFT_964847 [Cantharellus anzutake]KAF8331767.1 hypothetical protein EI90DRAFT_964847 [Cantharellus anzutake]